MSGADDAGRGFSLRRWSARKRAAVAPTRDDATAPPSNALSNGPPPKEPSKATFAAASPSSAEHVAGAASTPAAAEGADLPPIDSLTHDSDFTPFMRPDVAPELRSAALRKLFTDPHFKLMDGLDVYIDDYSKPDPISPDIVKTLNHARYIFAPPQTRVNAQGVVEEVALPETPPVEAQPPAIAGTAGEEAPKSERAPEQIPIPLDPPSGDAP